jgi:superfamily II DNA or RNA helicase
MGEEFTAGSRVSARGLAWDVVDATPLGAQMLLRLRCIAGDLHGIEWNILHPAERVERLYSELRPDCPGSLEAWRLYHQACLLEQILGPGDMPVAALGRVRIEPYQLVPLMRALESPRPRLLLADDVGLGKTVEAGLIVSELIARRRAHRVLVVSPPGPLLVQWAQELRHRFGLRFTTITDATSLQAQRLTLEYGEIPFNAIALCLTSLDFAKQERILEDLERSGWDLAIIDEAHHCISSGTSTDRENTQRRRLAEVIARRSDGLLLLTATPHDGYDPHFASLVELLDPSLVDGRGGLVGTTYRRHIIRRLKSHIRDRTTGAPSFCERRVVPVKVDIDGLALEPVRQFHSSLAALIAPRLRRLAQRHEHADALAFVSLLKRSVSTIHACVNTLNVVAERYRLPVEAAAEAVRRERARSLRAYRKRLLKFGVLDDRDEQDMADLEADGMSADLHSFAAPELAAITRTDATTEALGALIRLGQNAEPLDPKLQAVKREVSAIRAQHPMTNILIYTEYADSQSVLVRTLRDAVDGEVLAISGLDSERERTRIAECFSEEDGIILVSTDTLAEGLNLQRRCFNLIHVDLPYNPNRLEQRNGRIDRYGQEHDPMIRYLYLADTFEEQVLLHLIAKYEKARTCLTFMPGTLGVTADQAASASGLVAGFAERQASLFEEGSPAIRTLDREAQESNADAYKDLLREIDRAFAASDHSAVRYGWLSDQTITVEATAERCDTTSNCAIDLPDFVAGAIAAATGSVSENAGVMRLPGDWLLGLDDQPGVDHEHRTLRFTRDQSKFHDARGQSMAFLGRGHPLVRRAIGRIQQLASTASDHRVSVARTDADAPAVVMTFSAEMHSAVRIEVRRVIAVFLPMRGKAVEINEPDHWLQFASPERSLSRGAVWRDLFADWVPKRLLEVEPVAMAAAHRETERVADVQHRMVQQESDGLGLWLSRRAEDICGPFVPEVGDLFGSVAERPGWQTLPESLDRLAAFAADPNNTPARRRDAIGAVDLFHSRSKEYSARTMLSSPTLLPTGMLMLVPSP